ncbi:hypothetical protein [Variovorax sp.]|jgi:hypothetical protein|uniref:hypothetical protein n=1 Tax=Variovorax sp. TaxID=1871043 RepID=UPI0037D9C1AB
MSNSLIKSKTFVPFTVERPYRPPRPQTNVWELRTVCGYRYYGPDPNAGRYVTVTDPLNGKTTTTWVPNPGTTSPNGVDYFGYACRDELVMVQYPADPGQPYVPGVPSHWDYLLGWNAGARSRMFLAGDANATFQARASIVGAVVGLNGHEDPINYNGTSTKFAFYLARGMARVVELGVTKTGSFAYTDNTVFKVDRTGGQITYFIDDTLVYTSAVEDSTEILWLQASLYSGDDEIFNPVLHQVSPLDDDTPVTGTLSLTLPAPAFAARERAGGVLRLELPAPKPSITSGLAAPSFALLSLTLPPVFLNLRGLVGTRGELKLDLPAPGFAASDRPTGQLKLQLPAPWFLGRSWPQDTLYVDGLLRLGGAVRPRGVAVLPTRPLEGVLGGEVAPYAEVTLRTVSLAGILGGSMAARGEVTLRTAPMVGVLRGSISILSGLNELWVLNMAGGKPGGTTQYEGFDFNSFVRIGGRYYGARHDGLYLLEGEDDAGQAIDATFGLGQLNFGNAQKKTVGHCYLGAAAGALQLTIDALLNDVPASFTYSARGHGETMRAIRFDLGKGLKSTYVVPTFNNEDGERFKVDTLEFLVHDLTRKI